MNSNKDYLFGCAEKDFLTIEDIEKIAYVYSPKEKTHNNKKLNAFKLETETKTIPAGFTYFGQFISHDIVPPTNSSSSASKLDVSAQLNLDCLYGHPSCHHILFDEQGFFKPGPSPSDLLRDHLGNVIIPESRNAENLIIFQFHRLWQKIHDAFVAANILTPELNLQQTAFESAKKATIAIFQLITIDDYLKKLLDKRIYEHYFVKAEQGLLCESQTFTRVPFEFSHAAFRFGHSMVRTSYNLSQSYNYVTDSHVTHFRNLSTLLVNKMPERINRSNFIDWHFFFDVSLGASKIPYELARGIDLDIVTPMFSMPAKKNIVSLNLKAAADRKVKNGFEVLHTLQSNKNLQKFFINPFDLNKPSSDKFKELKPYYKNKILPLWLYILDEAGQTSKNNTLGLLGSVIVADVIRKSIYEHCNQTANGLLTYKNYKEKLIDVFKENCGLVKKGSRTEELSQTIMGPKGCFEMAPLIRFILKEST